MSRRLQLAVHCAIDARNTTGESPLWSAPVVALRTGFHRFDLQTEALTFLADGELIRFVEMPINHPTMPCFGGPAGRTMDVTSHREDHSLEEVARTPQAGVVYMPEPGVASAPAACYHYQG